MTSPVRRTSPADQAWADLAAQLTPAASLARIDAVTSRAITTITVIGVLLTGLGALGAGQFAHRGAARDLAVAAVITATLAVASALYAQVLTITRRLNPANLTEVQAGTGDNSAPAPAPPKPPPSSSSPPPSSRAPRQWPACSRRNSPATQQEKAHTRRGTVTSEHADVLAAPWLHFI